MFGNEPFIKFLPWRASCECGLWRLWGSLRSKQQASKVHWGLVDSNVRDHTLLVDLLENIVEEGCKNKGIRGEKEQSIECVTGEEHWNEGMIMYHIKYYYNSVKC